jgi:hypothetical protein
MKYYICLICMQLTCKLNTLGTYKSSSSRASSQKKTMIITTTRAIYHIQRLGKPLIQLEPKLGPWCDKDWTHVPVGYYLPKTNLADMTYANIPGVRGSITLSEEAYVRQEVDVFVLNCACELLERKTNLLVSDAITPDNPRNLTSTSKLDDKFPIECPACKARFKATGRKFCDSCGFKGLPLVKEARDAIAMAALIENSSKQPNYLGKTRHNLLSKKQITTDYDPASKKLKSEAILKSLSSSSSSNSSNIDNAIPVDLKSIRTTQISDDSTPFNTDITAQVLPSLNVNPSSFVNIQYVMRSFLTALRVKGVVNGAANEFEENANVTLLSDEESEVLEWIWAVSDFGAADFTALENDPDFKRIRQIFGPGHSWAVILKSISSVMFAFGLEPLANLYGGYSSPKAISCLESGANLRKTRDFFKLIRRAFTNAMLREYLDTLIVGQIVDSSPESAEFLQEAFNSHLNNIKMSSSDVVLRSWIVLIFQVLPALDLIEKAMRNNHMAAFWGAVLSLLPFLVLRNNFNYINVILREVGQFQYCLPSDEVLEEYKLIWSFFGQGLDFILEEVNRRIKRQVTRGSFQEYLVASILHDKLVYVTEICNKALGIKTCRNVGEYKDDFDDMDYMALDMENWLVHKRFCKVDPSRTEMIKLNGDSLLKQSNMEEFMSHGQKEVASFATAFRLHKIDPSVHSRPTLNALYAMTEAEQKAPENIRPVTGNFIPENDEDMDLINN